MKKHRAYGLIGAGVVAFLSIVIYLIHITLTQYSNLAVTFSWSAFFIDIAASIPFMLLAIIADYHLLKFLNSNKSIQTNLSLRIIIEVVGLVSIAIIFSIIGNLSIIKSHDGFFSYLHEIAFSGSIAAAILINIFAIIVIEFFFQYRKSLLLQNENIRMQYSYLKNQINPHFLFNSLNVLASLINKDTQKATEYTHKFSAVYRYVLTYDQQDKIMLQEELEFIRNYTEILKIRYGLGLQISISLLQKDLHRFIPPMSLQVLVENAVKHNAISIGTPLHITIISNGSDIVVSNNIIPRIRVAKGTGIGLYNLKQKYKIIANKVIGVENSHNLFIVKLPLL